MRIHLFLLGPLLASCAAPLGHGRSFEQWDRKTPTGLLRVCNEYGPGLAVELDGAGQFFVAGRRCAVQRVLAGRHFLIVRVPGFAPGRVRQPGWVLSIPKGLTQVTFGDRKNLVDLVDLLGEGAEAWPFTQTTPGFETALRRPLAPAELVGHGGTGLEPFDNPLASASGEAVRLEPPPRHLRTVGRPFEGKRPSQPPEAGATRPAPQPESQEATVVLSSTKPGVVVQRSAVVVSESGLWRRSWQRICELPCRFQVAPGKYRIRLDGPSYQELITDIELRPGENEVLVRPGYVALQRAGVATLAVGAILAITGGALAATKSSVTNVSNYDYYLVRGKPDAPPAASSASDSHPGAYGLLAGGLGGIAAGVTMLLLGRTTLDARPPALPATGSLPAPPGLGVGLAYGTRF